MYGAILGDMIGAPYEFDRGNKTKEFPLFVKRSHFTDDSVMTVAVAEALLNTLDKAPEEIRAAVVRSMQKWGRKYPNAGYGGKFYWWLKDSDPQPYNSWGNGSAMRVSAAGWLFGTMEETRDAARLTAEVTHNHPEGIKGAEAMAAAIFLARTGSTKEEIREYIVREFGYDLSRTCDEIRPDYRHVESCQQTVPEAITAFLEGTDFEDVIRTAVSLGGDCDTLTCIAGGIAEAFYGVPEELKEECRKRLPEDMREVLDRFEQMVHSGAGYHDPFLEGNEIIEEAIRSGYEEKTHESFVRVLESIRHCMHENGHFLIPVVVSEDGSQFTFRTVTRNENRQLLAAFTSPEEYRKGEPCQILSYFIDTTLKVAMERGMSLLINPWGQSFELSNEMLQDFFRKEEEWEEKRKAALEDGSLLKEKIGKYLETRTERDFLNIMPVLEDSWVYVPCTAIMSDADQKKIEDMVLGHKDDLEAIKGETFTSNDPIRFIPDILQKGDEFFFPVFTSEEEMGEYGNGFSKIAQHMQNVLVVAQNNEKKVSGIVINAFTEPFVVNAEMFPGLKKAAETEAETEAEAEEQS